MIGQKCVSSKQKSIGYRFPRTRRFSNSKKFIKLVKTYEIGPGSYEDKTITADGEYILSNMRTDNLLLQIK